MNCILSPCGTSCLTNFAGDHRGLVTRYSNQHNEKIPEQARDQLQKIIKKATDEMTNASSQNAALWSAELNAIVRFYSGKVQGNDHHILISTDTWLGQSSASIVETWLSNQGHSTDKYCIKDLQTDDLHAFQLALADIAKFCAENVSGYHHSGYRVIFNLTGGFKSVQGFLQTLAMFYADEAIYIFEGSDDLLKIPRLPVKMATEDFVAENLEQIRRISMNLPVDSLGTIPETMLLTLENERCLSPWGELIWYQCRPELYRKEVYQAPCSLARFGNQFQQNIDELAPDKKEELNKRLDDLARYLETLQAGEPVNPNSLRFKKLKGGGHHVSTHEFNAWAHEDAKRVFCHFDKDNNTLILDKLDKGLH